jgi:hypothetical protein
MRTFSGRSDCQLTHRTARILDMGEWMERHRSRADYYNRLESRTDERLLETLLRNCLQPAPASEKLNGRAASTVPAKASKITGYLSLVRERKSCNKQDWHVTRLGRGMAS